MNGLNLTPNTGNMFSMLSNGLVDPGALLKYLQAAMGSDGGGTVLDHAHARVLGQFMSDKADGSEFGGGDIGVANRDVEMMGRGRAPLTAEGLARAVMNAVGALKGAISPTGLVGLGMTATGTRPKGIVGNLLGGDIQSIPGYSSYDRDLEIAVGTRHMTRARADAIMGERQANRRAEGMQGRDFAGGTGNRSVAGGRSAGGLAVGSDGRIAGGI